MQWTQENVIKFINLYESREILWNQKHLQYFNKIIKNHVWTEVAQEMNCSVLDLKRKIEGLLGQMRREKAKMKMCTGQGADTYVTSWYAYEHLKFLGDRKVRSRNRNIVVEENEQSTENTTDGQVADDSNQLDTEDDDYRKRFKRHHSPDERPMSTHHNIEYPVYYENPQQVDDECDVLAKLWARKLRKLPEDRREDLVFRINNLVYKECINSRQSAGEIVSSPMQIFKEESVSDCYSVNGMGSPQLNGTEKETES